MRFLGSLTLFLASARAAATVDDLITTFNAFKDAATELQGDARQVDADICASFGNDKGPLHVCVNTFYAAVEQGTEFAATLGGSPDYCGARADDLMEAYTGFTDAHQRLFNILSHRGGEVAEVRKHKYPAAGDAVVSALSGVKDITTAMAEFMEGHLPCKKPRLDKESDRMGRALGMCIRKWKRVCGKECAKKDYE